jgi:hypothetical protein
LDRVNISIAGHSIQQEFHLDNIQLGWVFSDFVAGYASFRPQEADSRIVLARAGFWR